MNPGSARSPGEENRSSLQYSCLENSMDRGAWWAIVHGMAELDMTEQLICSLPIEMKHALIKCKSTTLGPKTTIAHVVIQPIFSFFAALGLHWYTQVSSSCGKWGLLSSCGAHVSHRGGLSSCGEWALGHLAFSS